MRARGSSTLRIFGPGLCSVLLVVGPDLRAQQSTDELRNLAKNPVGDTIKVPVTESIGFDAGPYHRTAHSLQILPVIPMEINTNWLLIPRIVTTAVAFLPDVTSASGGFTGVGDSVATFFITPVHTQKLIWGVGPSLLIPTSTNADIGGEKWGLGPSVAVLTQPRSAGIWSRARRLTRTGPNRARIAGWCLLEAVLEEPSKWRARRWT